MLSKFVVKATRLKREESIAPGTGSLMESVALASARMPARHRHCRSLSSPKISSIQYDSELTRPVARRLGEFRVQVLTGVSAKGLAAPGEGGGEGLLVKTADGEDRHIAAEKILVTVGRRPLTEGWGLEVND